MSRSRRVADTSVTQRAVKLRLYPSVEQAKLLKVNFDAARFMWNKLLSDSMDYYYATDSFHVPYPASYKKDFPWLRQADSLALNNARLNLMQSFSCFFNAVSAKKNGSKKKFKNCGKPQFKSKKRCRPSYTTNNQHGTVAFDGKYVRLPKVGYIKVRGERSINPEWRLKNATVTQSRSGKYFVSIIYEFDTPSISTNVDFDNALGLDYSSPHFYVDSEGREADYPRYYRLGEAKLAKLQRRVSKKTLGSKNREKAKRKLAKFSEHIANQRKDFCHKLSNEITNHYDIICVEDLNMQNMARTLKLGKSTNDNGFGEFRRMLQYKCEDKGKFFVTIDKWFPSTKTCFDCGYILPQIGKEVKEWTCPHCGKFHNRDHNAAKNIKRKGIEELMFKLSSVA